MKKTIVIAIALFLGSLVNVNAQDAEFKADAIKLTKMSSGAAEAGMAQVYTMIPEDKVEDFKKELEPIMDEYYEKIAVKSMEYYTHDDVKELLDFYNSEIGQKSLKVQEEMAKAAMGDMAQELQYKVMPILQKYMQR
jgi:hypothetical protein